MPYVADRRHPRRTRHATPAPASGDSFFDMERSELDTKYTRITADAAREEVRGAGGH